MEKSRFHKLLDILLPPSCAACKKEALFICGICRENITEYKYFTCPVCKIRSVDGRLEKDCRKESGLTRYLGAPLPYSDERVKKIIHSFKYNHAKEIANPLSQILIEFLDKNGFGEIADKYRRRLILVPVPLFDFRERERGFNQATEIARIISANYGIPLAEKLLVKRKYTEPQAEIKKKEDRAKNIAGAFAINPNNKKGSLNQSRLWRHDSGQADPNIFLQNKIAILVDDVYTSGATMRECALVLRNAGAAQAWGITVARG